MDAEVMADVEATVAVADGVGALPDDNGRAVFYNTFCGVASLVFCNEAHEAVAGVVASAGAAVHRN
ncbi:hypothetical protein LL912_15220 [Niabella sp. CC-SYL272]|uniref:hypothetical protein n=1 Tax=Niabella agricola TaxID=2891571 RepID=UPI001F47F036|nr:hypothetical protein [Niabella agricola]MCF3110132.1 hypothetical protein [Niabella agricola]